MKAIIGMGIMAALYALYIIVRPRQACGGNCGSCGTSCHSIAEREEDHEAHV